MSLEKRVMDKGIFQKNIEALTHLTSFDQLDAKNILFIQHLGLIELINNPEVDQGTREVAILAFNADIPPSLKDNKFVTDCKKSVLSVPQDTRRENCGRKVGKIKCPNLNKRYCFDDNWICPQFENCEMKQEVLNPIGLLTSIVGLLDRSGLWIRKTPKTVIGADRRGERINATE